MYETDFDGVCDVWLICNDTAGLYTLPTALTDHRLIRVSLKEKRNIISLHLIIFVCIYNNFAIYDLEYSFIVLCVIGALLFFALY